MKLATDPSWSEAGWPRSLFRVYWPIGYEHDEEATMRRGGLMPLMIVLLYPGGAWAQKTEVEFTLRNCNKVEASAILGVNATGCLIYDVRKREASTTIEVCGGLMLKLALKEVLLGGEFGHEKIGCVTIKTVLTPSETKEAVNFLKSPSAKGEEIRRLTLDQVKGLLRRANESDLKALGITRDQVEGLNRLRFESPKDATPRRDQIRKSLDACSKVEPRGIS